MNTSNQSNQLEGVWMPIEIIRDSNLSLQEKFILSMIKALDKGQGCFATNKYFAELLQVKARRVSEIIGELVEKKYITSVVEENYRRTLKVVQHEPENEQEVPTDESKPNQDGSDKNKKESKVIPIKKVMFEGKNLMEFEPDVLQRIASRMPEVREVLISHGVIEEVDSEWDDVKQLKFVQ